MKPTTSLVTLALLTTAAIGLAPSPASAQPVIRPGLCDRLLRADLGAYDLTGAVRCLDIVDSWADPVAGGYRISYQLEHMGTGSIYRLVIDRLGAAPRLRVFDPTGTLEVMVKAVAGAGTTVTTAAGVAIGSSWSPFVLDAATVGGVTDTDAVLLVDQQILSALPPPLRWTGGGSASVRIALAYASLVTSYAELYDTFRFRADVSTMASADVTSLEAAVAAYIATGDSDLIHNGPDGIADTDGVIGTDGIDHDIATETIDEALGEYGGFWNGHRYLMRACEDYIQGAGGYLPPFGRVPAWAPEDAVPAAFPQAGGTGPAIPTDLYAGTVCTMFPTAAAETDPDMMMGLYGYTMDWHGDVHTDADLRPLTSADSLFFAWHTTVDTIWANWEQCQI